MTKSAKLIFKLSALAILGVASALLFPLIRAHSANWRGWGSERPGAQILYGYSPVSDGYYTRWEVRSRFGCTTCDMVLIDDRVYPLSKQVNRALGWKRGAPPSWAFASEHPSTSDLKPYLEMHDVAYGWPFRCLAARTTVEEVAITDGQVAALMGIKVGDRVRQAKVLQGHFVSTMHDGWRSILYPDTAYWPTRILWPTLAANAAVATFILASPFLLWRGFVAGRAKLRRQSDRCVACGFSRAGIGAEASCPECGKAP